MQRSPTRGEDAANAAGEGTADEARSAPQIPGAPSFSRSSMYGSTLCFQMRSTFSSSSPGCIK